MTPYVTQCLRGTGCFPLCLVSKATEQKKGTGPRARNLASCPGFIVDQLRALGQATLGHCLLISKMRYSLFHKTVLSVSNPGAFTLAVPSGWVFLLRAVWLLPATFLIRLTLTSLLKTGNCRVVFMPFSLRCPLFFITLSLQFPRLHSAQNFLIIYLLRCVICHPSYLSASFTRADFCLRCSVMYLRHRD